MTAVHWMKSEKALPRVCHPILRSASHGLVGVTQACGGQVVVLGTSVGGSSAIMAAAADPTIDGVIAENPVACVGIMCSFLPSVSLIRC